MLIDSPGSVVAGEPVDDALGMPAWSPWLQDTVTSVGATISHNHEVRRRVSSRLPLTIQESRPRGTACKSKRAGKRVTPQRRSILLTNIRRLHRVKTFDELFVELTERARTRPDGSGTVAALDDGVHAQGKKVLEEAGEVWIAAEHDTDERLAEEISQLLYRVQVLMLGRGISTTDVYRYL